jgi:hypothetical protein
MREHGAIRASIADWIIKHDDPRGDTDAVSRATTAGSQSL